MNENRCVFRGIPKLADRRPLNNCKSDQNTQKSISKHQYLRIILILVIGCRNNIADCTFMLQMII